MACVCVCVCVPRAERRHRLSSVPPNLFSHPSFCLDGVQETKVHLQRSQEESEKNMREFLEAKQKAAKAAAEE